MNTEIQNSNFQRIENVRKFLKIKNYADFSRKIGVNNQVFTEIKSGKCGISKRLTEAICSVYPQISPTYLLAGIGGISGNTTIEANNSNNNAAIIGIGNVDSAINDRLLSLLEAANKTIQDNSSERKELLEIIKNLIKSNNQ